MLLGSSIGSIGHPFYLAFAWVIAGFYSLIPNYAIAIALLTLTVMIVVFPITLKGTRGMMKMQLLAPQMKVVQQRYKTRPGASVEERQEARQKLNEEMMALYKENNANPAGGCVPMIMQIPVFLVLYGTIRGLTHSINGKVAPLYIAHGTRLYRDILHAHGQLRAFGINLADSVRSVGLSWPAKLPFIALILVAIALQYVQMKQMSGRNPAAAQANPQMQQMQKIFPIFFALIYISIPAGVNIYFIVSSLFRIGQQAAMYRWDPHIQVSMHQLRTRAGTAAPPPPPPRPGGILARLRPETPALGGPSGPTPPATSGNGNGTPPRAAKPVQNGNGNGNGNSAANRRQSVAARQAAKEAAAKGQPRSRDKRPRRAR